MRVSQASGCGNVMLHTDLSPKGIGSTKECKRAPERRRGHRADVCASRTAESIEIEMERSSYADKRDDRVRQIFALEIHWVEVSAQTNLMMSKLFKRKPSSSEAREKHQSR